MEASVPDYRQGAKDAKERKDISRQGAKERQRWWSFIRQSLLQVSSAVPTSPELQSLGERKEGLKRPWGFSGSLRPSLRSFLVIYYGEVGTLKENDTKGKTVI